MRKVLFNKEAETKMANKKKALVWLSVGALAVVIFIGICLFVAIRQRQLSKVEAWRGDQYLFSGKGQTADAVRHLEKALRLDPNNDEAERNLLQAYLQLKQHRNIIAMKTTQLTAATPNEWDNFHRRIRIAESHIELGEIDKAKKIFQSLSERYKNAPSSYLGLAECYEKEGNFSDAAKEQEVAVSIMKQNPKYTPKTFLKKEMQKLIDLYKQAGQEDSANKWSQELLALK